MDPSLPVHLNIIIQYFWVLQSFAFSSALLSLLPLALSTQISLLKQSLGKAYVNSPQVIKCENKGWTKNSLRQMKRTGFFFFFFHCVWKYSFTDKCVQSIPAWGKLLCKVSYEILESRLKYALHDSRVFRVAQTFWDDEVSVQMFSSVVFNML